MSLRAGLGFDVHRFGGDGPLVLGGVLLPGPGLLGHSDGDVVAHAVADALLGAAGLGDLGMLFPATDERHRDADSIELLRDVSGRLAAAGWRLVNVDVAVVAERPALAEHVEAMVDNLGRALASLTARAGAGAQPRDGAGRGRGPAGQEHRGDEMSPGGEHGEGAPQVSVKPKFGEGVGALGRGEGVAAWAIALLDREASR